jgi:hypothetical protein
MRRVKRYGGREELLAILGSTCLWQAGDSSPTLGTGSPILAYLSLRGTFLLRYCQNRDSLLTLGTGSTISELDSGIDTAGILN